MVTVPWEEKIIPMLASMRRTAQKQVMKVGMIVVVVVRIEAVSKDIDRMSILGKFFGGETVNVFSLFGLRDRNSACGT